MNLHTIQSARRSRLSRQQQMLREVDQNGRQVPGGDVDLDRAPAVLREFGVPRLLSEATLAGSEFARVDGVRDWLVDVFNGVAERRFALFIGDGSNYTAAAVLRNAVKQFRTVSWITWHNFTKRYTDNITRGRLLDQSNTEEQADAAHETYEAEEEDFRLRQVYDFLAIPDFDITDVRDFAVPDIVSLIRERTDAGLATIITVPTAHDVIMKQNAGYFDRRGPLVTLFESVPEVFDGRPRR